MHCQTKKRPAAGAKAGAADAKRVKTEGGASFEVDGFGEATLADVKEWIATGQVCVVVISFTGDVSLRFFTDFEAHRAESEEHLQRARRACQRSKGGSGGQDHRRREVICSVDAVSLGHRLVVQALTCLCTYEVIEKTPF